MNGHMDYSEYNIAFNVCAGMISIGLLFIHYTRKELHGPSHHTMAALLSTMAVSSFLYMVLYLFEGISNPYGNPNTARFFIALTLFHHNSIPFLFMFYVFFLTGQSYRPHNRLLFVLSNISLTFPLLASYALVITNLFNGYVTTIDANGVLTINAGRYWLMAFALIYILYSVYLVSRFHKALRTPQFVAVIITCGIEAMMLIFQQTFLDGLSMDIFALAFGCAGIMFTSEDRLAVQDTTTSAFNRDAFYFHTRSSLYAKNDFRMIVVKLANYNECASLVGSEKIDDAVAKIVEEIRGAMIPRLEFFLYRPDVLIINSYSLKDEDHHAVLRTLESVLQRDYDIGNLAISFAAEVSYVHVPRDVKDMQNIIRLIELPPNLGDKRYALVRNERLKENERRSHIADALLQGVQNHSFEVHYLPIYDVKKDGVAGCEALVRLTDPELGAIGPSEFIPVAEQIGVITKIGRIVFEQVCKDFHQYDFLRYGVDRVLVNLSLRQFLEPDFPAVLNRDMFTYHLSAENIAFTINGKENDLFRSPSLYPAAEGISKLGISFAISHYGFGGQTFLTENSPFDVHFILIDRTTIAQARATQRGDAYLRALLDLANHYGLTAVAEGIETDTSLAQLKSMNVRYLMGYYYAHPMPVKDFIAYCSSHPRRH